MEEGSLISTALQQLRIKPIWTGNKRKSTISLGVFLLQFILINNFHK